MLRLHFLHGHRLFSLSLFSGESRSQEAVELPNSYGILRQCGSGAEVRGDKCERRARLRYSLLPATHSLFRRRKLPVRLARYRRVASGFKRLSAKSEGFSLLAGKIRDIRTRAGPAREPAMACNRNGGARLPRIRPNSTSGTRWDEACARNCTPPPISARYTTR
jgi:hypothetical protein